MSENRKARRVSTTALGIAVLIVALAWCNRASAQWTPLPPPPSSAYWWTLTDEITPSQLREALQDRDLNRERFRAAAARHHRGVVTEQQIHEVESYLDGELYPELVPMYVAFESFAARFQSRSNWSGSARQSLQRHGVHEDAIQEIIETAHTYNADRNRVIEEVRQPTAQLMAILRPYVEEVGNSVLMKLLVANDVDALAELTGEDPSTLATLRNAWARQPIVEASLPALHQLRETISGEDWQAFREFLLFEIAPMISGTEYENG